MDKDYATAAVGISLRIRIDCFHPALVNPPNKSILAAPQVVRFFNCHATGREFQIAANNSPGGIPCHLHGGLKGFDKVLWSGTATSDNVELTYLSKDGEEGYPGNLETENFLDAPNQPEFPGAVLCPGETYTHTMIHRFHLDGEGL